VRNIVKQAFTSTRIHSLERTMRATVGELVERAGRRTAWDIVEGLASPLPLTVIASVLDIDFARLDDLRRWTAANLRVGAGALTRRQRREATESVVECNAFLTDHIDRAAGQGGNGCIAEFLAGTGDGERLTRSEAADIALLLMIGGTETTTNLI